MQEVIAESSKDEKDEIVIPLSEYIELCSDRALLKELEKQGLTELPMYDKAILKTFLHSSRRF